MRNWDLRGREREKPRRNPSVSKGVQGDIDYESPWERLPLGLCIYLCR